MAITFAVPFFPIGGSRVATAEVKNPMIVIEWGEDLRDAVKHFLKCLGRQKTTTGTLW
jgi:hypothetical protein